MRQHFLDTPNVKRVFNINLTLQNYEKKAVFSVRVSKKCLLDIFVDLSMDKFIVLFGQK